MLKSKLKIEVMSIFNAHIVVPWEGRIWGTKLLTLTKAGTNLPTPKGYSRLREARASVRVSRDRTDYIWIANHYKLILRHEMRWNAAIGLLHDNY